MAGEYPPGVQYPQTTSTRSYVSSRHSYPSFISILDTLLLQLRWIWRGLYDAFRWKVVFAAFTRDPEVRVNLYKSLLLNTLSLLIMYTFEFIFPPPLHNPKKLSKWNTGWLYHAPWLLPVVGTLFYLNSSWCSIIAKRAYILQYGTRTQAQPPATYTGMLNTLATSAYRVVMVFNSVFVSFALHNIPYVGGVAGFAFMCWIDAYYCFEFVWIARGLSLSRRIRHLEERWAYYFAFGLPSAAICMWGSGLANAIIFALVFPVYVILAMAARPVPQDPYNPLSTSHPEETEVIKRPSPFVPIRLPIFALVMWLNDTIVRILSVGSRSGLGHSRSLSDTTETVEEGHTILSPEPRPMRQPRRARINIGRRKAD